MRPIHLTIVLSLLLLSTSLTIKTRNRSLSFSDNGNYNGASEQTINDTKSDPKTDANYYLKKSIKSEYIPTNPEPILGKGVDIRNLHHTFVDCISNTYVQKHRLPDRHPKISKFYQSNSNDVEDNKKVINGDISISLSAAAVNVSGYAQVDFLEKKNVKSSMRALKFKYEERIERLNLDDIDETDFVNNEDLVFTHVVSSITYGKKLAGYVRLEQTVKNKSFQAQGN